MPLSFPSFAIGHSHTDVTGVTVIACPPGTVGGLDVRGAAPGTHETDLLDPSKSVTTVHAVVLTGGSAPGLSCIRGVVEAMIAAGHGLATPAGVIPIVPGACLFDCMYGSHTAPPTAAMAAAALAAAIPCCGPAGPPQCLSGRVGAGRRLMSEKWLGHAFATPSGIGCSSLPVGDGPDVIARVTVLAAVNAVGAVERSDGNLLAAATILPASLCDGTDEDRNFVASADGEDDGPASLRCPLLNQALAAVAAQSPTAAGGAAGNVARAEGDVPMPGCNTTLVVALVSDLHRGVIVSKEDANVLAACGHDGMSKVVVPCHSSLDGDTVFVLAANSSDAVPAASPFDAAYAGTTSRMTSACDLEHASALEKIGCAIAAATATAIINAMRDEFSPSFQDMWTFKG